MGLRCCLQACFTSMTSCGSLFQFLAASEACSWDIVGVPCEVRSLKGKIFTMSQFSDETGRGKDPLRIELLIAGESQLSKNFHAMELVYTAVSWYTCCRIVCKVVVILLILYLICQCHRLPPVTGIIIKFPKNM